MSEPIDKVRLILGGYALFRITYLPPDCYADPLLFCTYTRRDEAERVARTFAAFNEATYLVFPISRPWEAASIYLPDQRAIHSAFLAEVKRKPQESSQ